MGIASSATQLLAEKGLGVGGLGKVFAQNSVATLLQGAFAPGSRVVSPLPPLPLGGTGMLIPSTLG